MTGHKASLSSVAYSPDGRTLAVADTHDQTIKLWDMTSRQQVAVLGGHTGPVWYVTFSPDGRTLASTTDNTVQLWDITTKQKLIEFQQVGWKCVANFSPDGKLLAASGFVWDLGSRREVARLAAGYRAQFSPDGTLLAAGKGDTILLWDVATWQQVATLQGQTREVRCLAFAPDSRTLAVGEHEGTLRLWDVVKKQEIGSRRGHTSHIESMAFSPDSRRLATSGAESTVKLWDVSLLQAVVDLTGHEGPVNSLAFSPDGNTLASASADATVRLWHAPPLPVAHPEPANILCVPPVETIGRQFGLWVEGTAKATLATEGNVQQVNVTAVDGNIDHAVLFQKFEDLQEGATYTVQFRAKADAAHRIRFLGIIVGSDWHPIGLDELASLTENWQAYQYQFQAKNLAAESHIEFDVGERTGTVWIADFTLTKGESRATGSGSADARSNWHLKSRIPLVDSVNSAAGEHIPQADISSARPRPGVRPVRGVDCLFLGPRAGSHNLRNSPCGEHGYHQRERVAHDQPIGGAGEDGVTGKVAEAAPWRRTSGATSSSVTARWLATGP